MFAPNEVTGASQFWYLMHQMRKMKKTTGEILDIVEVCAGVWGCCVAWGGGAVSCVTSCSSSALHPADGREMK